MFLKLQEWALGEKDRTANGRFPGSGSMCTAVYIRIMCILQDGIRPRGGSKSSNLRRKSNLKRCCAIKTFPDDSPDSRVPATARSSLRQSRRSFCPFVRGQRPWRLWHPSPSRFGLRGPAVVFVVLLLVEDLEDTDLVSPRTFVPRGRLMKNHCLKLCEVKRWELVYCD